MRKIPNTFGIDVTAARFLEYGSEDELRGLIAAGQVVAPWLHIGGGSNLLFIKDYEGTVLHSRIGGLEVTSEDEEHVSVRVGAGVVWDDFVAYCVERHWYGAENLSLIPGEVGGERSTEYRCLWCGSKGPDNIRGNHKHGKGEAYLRGGRMRLLLQKELV